MSKLKQHKPSWLQYRAANRVTAYMLKKAKPKAAKEQTRKEDWGTEF